MPQKFYLAYELQLSRNNVKRALNYLIRAGIMRKEPRWREIGSKTSNIYVRNNRPP